MSSPNGTRLLASSCSDSVSGPHTSSPCTRLLLPRSPAPYCTVFTCMSYQFSQNVQTMPPWCVMSRYQSAQPSQMHIAARCGGCSVATCHWFEP